MKRNRVIILLLIFLLDIICFYINDYNKDSFFLFFRFKEPIIVIPKNEITLLVGEEYKIDLTNVSWSTPSNVVSVEDGLIKANYVGETIVIASNRDYSDSIKVTVIDIITDPILNNDKEYLKCNQYSEEEERLIESYLESDINEAGYKTRAGVVSAARFLTLRFKYRLSYFYENGRLLTNGVRNYADGEGRYYHKGLYLTTNDYNELVSSIEGPATWGCPMYSRVVKKTSANGLDCSGFVSWALLNGGFDVGDAGAGISKKKNNDLDDLGPKIKITKESLMEKNFKVGDLFSRSGHIGILIGMDSEYFYIAESLTHDLHVLKMTKNDILKSKWKYIIDMSEVYKNDGNLTDMW